MELICAECKNKWMPSNRINEVICPYCGNIIGELSRDFSSFEDGIAYIRNMFGDDIFEQRRFFFICTEYCLDYYEKEISAFKILYDSGLSKRILNLRGSDEKIIVRSKKQFVYQLRMKNGMNTSWAEYVIDLFCFATGISTENEVVDASNQLGEYLPMLSEKGSKDDMSIALILDIDGMKGVFNPIKVRISETKGDIDLNVS